MKNRRRLIKLITLLVIVLAVLSWGGAALAIDQINPNILNPNIIKPNSPNLQLPEYSVTYHCNFTPAVDDVVDFGYTYDTVYTAKPGDTFDHPILLYFFVGWGTEPDGDVVYEPGDTFSIPTEYVRTKKHMDLYAIWDHLVLKPDLPTLNRVDHYAYMQGYPDGGFGPMRNMSRAEAVVMFSRLITNVIDDKGDYENTYTDVPLGLWYSNAIGYMEQYGVLSPEISAFRPNDKITRAEFADLACSFEHLTSGAENDFTDVPASHTYYDEINYAVARGWLAGYPDGTFRPDAPIKRSEVVAVTNRVLERYADQDYIDAHTASITNYNDITSGYWAYYDIMEASNGHEYTKSGATETWLSLQ